MVLCLSALLSVLIVVQTVTSDVTVQDVQAPRQLRPIHLRKYEASLGMQRRASEQFSSLDPQTQSQLIYGSPLENEQLLLANMTLFAPDGLQMVLLEEFDDLTSAVDCNGEDDSMSLTFKDQAAFNYALKTWNYINEKEDSKFLVIANHAGCGPDDQRQPYLISNIKEDATSLTTYLAAQPAPWSDFAGTYDMDFGKAIPFTRPDHLQSRSLWGDITGAAKKAVNGVTSGVKEVASDIGNLVTGNLDISKSVSFGMNAGTPNQKTQMFTDNTHLTLDCINCYIAGSIEVAGRISVHQFKLQDLSLDGIPHGLNGALELGAQITKYEKPDSWKFTKELFSAPVPDAGIEIPGIFKLGAILSYEVGVQAQLQGSATIDFGLSLSVPDTAGIHIDVMDPPSSTAQGLSGDIKPIFNLEVMSATIQLAAFAQPKLSFGIEITEVGTLDVELAFKSPQLAVKFIAAYDESGLCSHEPGASKTGVEIQTQIGLQLDFKVDASLGSANTIKPSYWAKLWQDYHQLSSSCWPLAIPGLLVPNNTLTALPSKSSSPANDSNTSSANFSFLTGSSYSAHTQPPILPPGLPTAAPLPGNGSGVVVPTGFLKSSLSGVAKPTGAFSTNGQVSGTGYPYPVQSNATAALPSGSGLTKLPSGSGAPVTPPGNGPTPSGVYPPFPIGSGSGLPISPPGNGPTATGFGFTKLTSGSGPKVASSGSESTVSGVYPPIPTGSPPPQPTGSAASSRETSAPQTETTASSGFASHSYSHSKNPTRRPVSRSSKHRSHTSTELTTEKVHTTRTTPKAPFPTDTDNGGTSTTRSGVASASHYRFRH